MNNLQYSPRGLALTCSFESLRLAAYQDGGGVWTIGYGHTENVRAGDICTPEQAERWLKDHTSQVSNLINQTLPVPLTQNQFDALVDFAYNVGWHAFETSSLWRFLCQNKYDLAATQFERWKYDNGVEVAGLLRRRRAEKQLFLER